MEKYINEIPLVVRNSIKALSDEKRQSILMYLLKSGSKSFTEISKDLEFSKNNLSHHIKTLVRYGLVYNYYSRNEFDDKYSFYEISKLGKVIMNNLIYTVIPLYSEKEDILTDTLIDKPIDEIIPIEADLTESHWAGVIIAQVESEVVGYRTVTENLIDANTGLKTPSKKFLEEESKLNILS